MGISKGLGPLGVHLSTEEGVSFQTDNEMFWSSCSNGTKYRVVARESKDLTSKFHLSLLPNGRVLLRDFRDMYVSCVESAGVAYLETDKCTPDALCEFEVFHDGERVILKASNGLFVCRHFRHHGDYIEASRPGMEDCCRFRTGMGDSYPPSFDISLVELGDVSNLNCRPVVLKKETFVNKTDAPQTHSFTLSWETRTAETTHWERTWGLSSTSSTTFSLLAFQATITYNGSFQKMATTHRSIVEKRSVTVVVPERSKVTAELVVSKMENATVPFTAFIRKTKVDGETLELVEKGVWKGLVYDSVTLETKQEPEGDEENSCRIL
ncbi:uncharacterized protein LOC100488384 [Xenopus tropicalis]|uniref:Uncharacterized protein LOC100488384 n=2 Tax=Xenopus tropicalis TaxID=8364 RepID=A0A8J0QZ10_XENTR|nr:uncharacterized protein LOC100488384 [Xenopus tropicalis]|eukprot:XP_002943282.1 PREDICTED: uncharacterized protein LOC100488384 [Xenopus tropicalis]